MAASRPAKANPDGASQPTTVSRAHVTGSVYKGRCLHAECWCASCPLCNSRVTAHDFTAEDAQAGLDDHMAKVHGLSGSDVFGAIRSCPSEHLGPHSAVGKHE